jgi:hypothetical protein
MFTKNNMILKTCITCRDNLKKRAEQRLREDPEGFITKRRASSRKHRQKMLRENPEGLRKKELENAQKYREKMSRENPERLREMIRNTNKKSREKKMKEDPDGFRHLESVRKKAYRQRKIEENPEELRARELKYYNANRETVLTRQRERNRLCVTFRLRNMKNGAKSREYEWALDDDAAMATMRGPCFYCGVLADCVHGLDRLDNFRGYTADNIVGCCTQCNKLKLCIDAHTFLQRCIHISGLEKHPAAWPDTKPGNLSTYRSNAKRKNRAFELTKDMFHEFINQPCVYCRRDITATNKSGIDRIRNEIGYVPGNMQSCCTECNRMRGTLTVEVFLEKASRIAARAELLLIPEMPTCLFTFVPLEKKRKQTEPSAPTKKTRARTGDAAT